MDQPGKGSHNSNRLPSGSLRPTEAPVVVLLEAIVDLDTRVAQLREHGIEVADAKVDHPRLLASTEVVGVGVERAPDGWPRVLLPDRIGVGPARHAQMLGVPGIERLGVLRSEEHTTDPGDPLHRG